MTLPVTLAVFIFALTAATVAIDNFEIHLITHHFQLFSQFSSAEQTSRCFQTSLTWAFTFVTGSEWKWRWGCSSLRGAGSRAGRSSSHP